MNSRGPESVLEAYADAVLNRRPDRLGALYAPEVTVFDAWARWSYEGREAWRANLDDWLGAPGDERIEVRFEDVRSGAVGDLGFVHAIGSYAALDPAGAAVRSMQNRLTWVLRQGPSGWLIAHEHTSAPIAPDHMTAILSRS